MKRSLKSQKRKGNRPRKTISLYAPEPARIAYMQAYLCSLIQDALQIFKGRYSNADATLDCIRITSRLRAEGSGFATKTLPALMTGLLNLKECGEASFPQFKLQRGTEHPAFLGRLFNLAINSVDLKVRTEAMNFIYTFSVSFKKLKGEYPDKVIRKLFADFVKTDVELENIDWNSKELRPILEDARAQWRIFVDETNLVQKIEAARPQPGPGATNRPTKKTERYRPHVFYTQLNKVMPYSEWFFATPYAVFNSETAHNGFFDCSVMSPEARFKAVPKTVGKPRGICIEENEVQVYQQAIRKAFYDAITEYFGDHIALRKQKVNALKALHSSLTREDATIDESEASDRVARLLVSILSFDNQIVHDILMGLSTKFVIPPDEIKGEYSGPVRTKKYAPMGSALCFPVMSLVHMFLVRAIIRLSTPQDVQSLVDRVYVYGDDIILPVESVEAVYKWLPKFGMKINENKSFYRSHFRESCGIHAYHGVDITPVYIKYIPYHHSPEAQASVFAVESQLFSKGYVITAEFQRRAIEEALGKKFQEVPDGLSLAGYARPPTDALLQQYKNRQKRKWSRKYQCFTYLTTRFHKLQEKTVITDQLDAYTRWMWEGSKDFNSDTVSDSYGVLTTRTRCVPESALSETSYAAKVFEFCKRYPTANARYTHPSRLGKPTRVIATAGVRCYC